mmetsp:Transcript_7913/g.19097  ORF Transcript_7913/g.19097 Transcript_7913/m.19097 type:complete len:288 (+) Transcript_7913:347-1210(+)
MMPSCLGLRIYSSSIELLCAALLFSTIARKCPFSFSRRFSGVSSSAILPSSRTRTLSLSMMVFRRWAIVKTVASAKFSRIISWMAASVSLSILAVASSMTRIFGFRSSERAMQSNWRWPWEKFSPPSATSSSKPFGSSAIASTSRTFFKTSHNSSSVAVANGSRLYRTVLENMTGSCGMMDRFIRRAPVPTFLAFRPSIRIWPPSSSSSEIRKRAIIRLLFPLPVRPHTPIFSPALTVRDRSFKTRGPSRYRIEAFENSTSPLLGHVPGLGSDSGISSGASGSMLSV